MNYEEVYAKMFNDPKYCRDEVLFRNTYVIENMKMKKFNSLIDISSGRGRLINLVKKQFPDTHIVSTDLANYHKIPDTPFLEINLSNPGDRDLLIKSFEFNKRDLLTCLDVLEHLDKSFVEEVFKLFSKVAKTSIFTIANHPEVINGVELHTIQEDMTYWRPIIEKYFKIVKFHDDIYFRNGKPTLYILYCEPLESSQ